MENLTLLTYTHSNRKNIHKIYFDRINKYFNNLKYHFILCDENIENHECILYNENEPYWYQMVNVLEKITTDYLIYSQEDYILFDYVQIDEINKLLNIMNLDKEIPFIRLIISGVGENNKKYNDELYYIDTNSNYYFSTQITLWRKDVLIKMFKQSNVNSIFDEILNSEHLLNITNKGLYTIKHGKSVGDHFNSLIYPYIATAIVKGKWNILEYEKELNVIFEEYKIDKNKIEKYE